MALISRTYSWQINPDGTIDGHFPTGNKDPNFAALSWGDLSSFSQAINQTTQGQSVTLSARAALLGTNASVATITWVTVSGSDVTASGFTSSGGNILISSSTIASGFAKLGADDGTGVVYSAPIQWSRVASVTDTLAPTTPLGLKGTPGSNSVTWTFDPSVDAHDGTQPGKGVKEYDLELNGVVQTIPGLQGITTAPTISNIGTISNPTAPTAVQSGNTWTLTAAGTGIDGTADQFLFMNWPLSGDCKVVCKVNSITGTGSSFSPCGLMIRESLAVGARYVSLYQFLSSQSQGIQGKQRVTTDAARSNLSTLVGTNTPRYLKIERVGNLFTLSYSLDGLAWSVLDSTTVAMTPSVVVGAFTTSISPGNPVTGTVQRMAVSSSPQLTYTQTTTVPTTARVRARDLQTPTPNVSSYSALTSSVTPLGAVKLIFDGTSEVGSTGGTTIVPGQGWALSTDGSGGLAPVTVTSPVRNGSHAIKFEDTFTGQGQSFRSEVRAIVSGQQTDTSYWYGWSMYLPSTCFGVGNEAAMTTVIGQFHANNFSGGGNPVLAFGQDRVTSGGAYNHLTLGGCYNPSNPWDTNAQVNYPKLDLGLITNYTDRWVDVVVNATWGVNGQTTVWVDGVQVLSRAGQNTFSADGTTTPYLKLGLYNDGWKNFTPSTSATHYVAYFDELRIGGPSASYNDVAPTANPLKWHPGYYVFESNYSVYNATRLNEILALPNCKGYKFRVQWSDLETSRGVYSWALIDNLLSVIRPTGKQLIVELISNSFSSTNPIPSYLATEPNAGGGWYVKTSPSTGYQAKVYLKAVMDRVIAFGAAFGARYDNDPRVEGLVMLPESSLPQGSTQGDYTDSGYLAQLLRIIGSIPASFSHTNVWIGANFGIQPKTNWPAVLAAMAANRCGLSAPDIYVQSSDNSTDADRASRGLVWNGTSWVSGGIDYRGVIPIAHDVQSPELGGKENTGSGQTLAALYTQSSTVNKDNHVCFLYKDYEITPTPPNDIYWDSTKSYATNPVSGSQDIKTFISGGASPTVSTLPSIYSTTSNGTLFPNFPYDPTRTVVAGAYYVDPVAGNDSNNGLKVSEGGTGPKRTVNAVVPLMGAGKTCYLMNGTHVVSSINNKSLGSAGTLGNPAVFTSLPGHTPVMDGNGADWLHLERSYFEFRHLKIQNYTQFITVAEDNTCTGTKFFCIDGTTSLGGDNVGLIHIWEAARAPNLVIDRVRITFTGGSVHLNTAGIYLKRTSASIATLDHLEIYGFPMSIYHKHGEPVPTVTGNATCSNSIFQGQTRANCSYNPSGWQYTNVIFGSGAGVQLSESDGGEAGDLNAYDHCTFKVGYTGTNQNGSAQPGAVNNKITNSLVTALTLQSPSTINAGSDYNLFPAGTPINNYGTSQNLAAWKTANSSDAHSVQGAPVYAGSDFTKIASYALQSGSPGKGVASDGKDIGVDITKIGVLAA